ncbi:hypothetical protein ACOSQ2_010397 [Xanthoceras sorbifolium]
MNREETEYHLSPNQSQHEPTNQKDINNRAIVYSTTKGNNPEFEASCIPYRMARASTIAGEKLLGNLFKVDSIAAPQQLRITTSKPTQLSATEIATSVLILNTATSGGLEA